VSSHHIDEGGDRGDAEHPAPGVRAEAGQQGVRRERDHDAEHDVELKHGGESPALRGRRDLRDVERRRHGAHPYADATDEPRHDEGAHVRCQGRPDGRREEQDADRDEGGAATESVGGPRADEGARHGPIERGAHGDPVHAGAQSPQALDRLLGAGDDHGVEAEQEAREGGDEGPEEQTAV